MVPVKNPMAHSRLSAKGSVWVLVVASHTIPDARSWKVNDCGNVIKVGNARCGAPTLLTNANGGKASRTTGKEVRFGSKMSSTF